MKLHVKRIAIITALLTAAGAKAWDASENQIWLDGSVSGKIVGNLSLKLTEQVRYKEEGDLYCYHHTDICTIYKLAQAWKLSAAFRHISTRSNATSPWTNKEMYHVNLINKLVLLDRVDFQTRMRFSYTDADNTDYLADVRPEFCIMPSKGFTGWKLKPYLADEIMYNLNERHLYRNRVCTGLMLAPAKALSLKLFIMHENTEKTEGSGFKENFSYGLFAGYKF
jgi:hypothetical protein